MKIQVTQEDIDKAKARKNEPLYNCLYHCPIGNAIHRELDEALHLGTNETDSGTNMRVNHTEMHFLPPNSEREVVWKFRTPGIIDMILRFDADNFMEPFELEMECIL